MDEARDRHREARDLTVEAAGETVGEATRTAMKALETRFPGITVESVDFETVGEGSAEVRVRGVVDLDRWRKAAGESLPPDPAERLRGVVLRVTQALGLEATVRVEDTEEELRAIVEGEDLGLLIGKHGTTIDALQHLSMRIALRGETDARRIVVDAAGYRARRENALQREADRAVADALRYGRPVELEPMRALERKVVHMYLRDRTDIETHSEGDEPERRLVVSPLRPAAKP
ncbi:MAG: RNA-binding cell elongation regulator Jag/EloR [Thermoleophilaceae bacterium]